MFLLRAVLVATIFAGCGKETVTPKPAPGSGSGSDELGASDEIVREQLRYNQERRPDLVIAAGGIGPGQTVADVGAGSGLLTLHVAKAVGPTGQVVATDIDRAVLDLLVARLKRENLADIVDTRTVAADTPGLEDGKYDVVLLAEVDHYFSDRVSWLATAKKALKPSGKIVLTNRVHHRAGSMAAAKQAGLVLRNESTPVPSHFIAVFATSAKL